MRQLIFILSITSIFMGAIFAQGDDPVEIGNRRELLLDDLLVDRLEGEARRVFHRPVAREVVMTFDDPNQGNTWAYPTVMKDGDVYRMWYRGGRLEIREDGSWGRSLPQHVAYAESRDGINWTRPNLGLVEIHGSKENNAVWKGVGSHAFVPFKDDNPDCLPEARYKAVGDRVGPGPWAEATKELVIFQSPDGIHWELIQEEAILDDGNFDSQNVAFWDPNISAYRTYYRFSQRAFGEGGNYGRGIKTATSPEFSRHWPERGTELKYEQRPPAQFYTNGIRPYHRAPHIYIGMPGMYDDRGWSKAMERLPNLEERRAWYEAIGRLSRGPLGGETLLMWSRDGVAFQRSPSGFLRPGPERPGSWWYGDHWVAWHLVETESTLEGAGPELSIYAGEQTGPHNLGRRVRRYTLRLDGFASIHAPIAGGELVTPPLVFEGSALSMNFASSAFGSLRVEIQDADGTPIPSFTLDDSIELYGDTVARNATWKGDPDLSALAGKPVRLRFVMRDADLYSIKFE